MPMVQDPPPLPVQEESRVRCACGAHLRRGDRLKRGAGAAQDDVPEGPLEGMRG